MIGNTITAFAIGIPPPIRVLALRAFLIALEKQTGQDRIRCNSFPPVEQLIVEAKVFRNDLIPAVPGLNRL